jgi:hypothetical protein
MEYRIFNKEVNSNSEIQIKMAQGGGFAMEIILLD